MKHSWRTSVGAAVLVLVTTSACAADRGRLTAPGEPDDPIVRAEAGILLLLPPGGLDLELDPLTGVVGTETLVVTLDGAGEPATIRLDGSVHHPAEGERLLVASLRADTITIHESVDLLASFTEDGAATFSVQVGSDVPVTVPLDPAVSEPQLLVISVPEDADRVDLIVDALHLKQRLSLLTGEPGPDNLAVLARKNRAIAAPVPAQNVVWEDNNFGYSFDKVEPIGITAASLNAASMMGHRQPARDRAYLNVLFDTPGLVLSQASELRLPDGTIIQPLAPTPDFEMFIDTPVVVYDVPANFTQGTLILGNDYTWEVAPGSAMSADFDSPVEYPIVIPAG